MIVCNDDDNENCFFDIEKRLMNISLQYKNTAVTLIFDACREIINQSQKSRGAKYFQDDFSYDKQQ